MKPIGYFIYAVVFCTACTTQKKPVDSENDNAKYIDPLICTSNDHGQTDPSASIPFGMVKPCPDTYPIAHSGYDYNSEEIIGFSHTRFSGVGCRGTGGNLRVLPYTETSQIPITSPYLKNSEIAKPGYYSVILKNNIKIELTATNQLAFHAYTFPESDSSGLFIDLASSFESPASAKHKTHANGYVSGQITSPTVCRKGKYSFFFACYLDKKNATLSINESKLFYSFPTKKDERIMAYYALSTLSEEQALSKLKEEREVPFSEVKTAAYQKWNDLMNVVIIETPDSSAKRLFYTHLYHLSQSPFLISEADGSYRGSDGEIYTDKLETYYHGWSIWDTFRSKLPLLSFLYPEQYRQMMNSLGELYKQGKADWATETEPFPTVRTEHSIIVLLEAHRKGLLSYSLDDIYPALKEEAKNLPFASPDNVLESSFDLWALSEIAKDLGYSEDTETFLSKAMDYLPLWKDKFQKMDETADIMHGDGLYEGTLWQYRWFVPFDIHGLQRELEIEGNESKKIQNSDDNNMKMLSGKEIFEQNLDYFFENELFNIGNQPDIQVPYLYAYTNSPWKTQKLVNSLLNEETNNWYGTHEKWSQPIRRKIFMDSPEGYIKEMDDDAGTMSAWYIWSTLGFYPVFPGSTQLVITSPQFDKITLKLPTGTIVIECKRPSDKSIYIQKIEIDGEEWNSFFIDYTKLINSRTIYYELGESPKVFK